MGKEGFCFTIRPDNGTTRFGESKKNRCGFSIPRKQDLAGLPDFLNAPQYRR